MNIIIISLIIFIIGYLILKNFANASSLKISKSLRILSFIVLFIIAITLAFAGRFLLTLPFLLLSFALVKLKGMTLFQLIALFRLIQTLRRSGRFSFNKSYKSQNLSSISLDEAFRILNLDINKKNTKEEINVAYKKIQKKIHPDISPETSRLSAIVTEARDIVLSSIS